LLGVWTEALINRGIWARSRMRINQQAQQTVHPGEIFL
jgi:hypothetical protein